MSVELDHSRVTVRVRRPPQRDSCSPPDRWEHGHERSTAAHPWARGPHAQHELDDHTPVATPPAPSARKVARIAAHARARLAAARARRFPAATPRPQHGDT
jgi:hypothetical protein